MKSILSVIAYCHSNGVVHGNLNPGNILFDSKREDGAVKIDFVTSLKFGRDRRKSKFVGSPYYPAPEALNKNCNEKCDIWSCGVLLYMMLCGYPPFNGFTEEQIRSKIKLGKFSFNCKGWDNSSKEARVLIRKMLELQPEARISAEAALKDEWIQEMGKKFLPTSSIKINKYTLGNLQTLKVQIKFQKH